jgi:hypothetical protein
MYTLNMRAFWIAMAAVLLAGCGAGKSKDERFFVFTAMGISNVTVTVNGEPVPDGIVGRYVINGNNTIELKCDISAGPLTIHLIRTSNLFSSNFESIWKIEDRNAKAEKGKVFRHEFKAEAAWNWTWEKADTIEKLSDDDKKQISGLFEKVISNVTKAVTSNTFVFDTNIFMPWNADPVAVAATMTGLSNSLKSVGSYKDLVVRRASSDQLTFESGRKTVVIQIPDEELYFVGHSDDYEPKSGEMVRSLQGEYMQFARFKGKWMYLYLTVK